LSEQQQTAGWIVFGIVFFSMCGVFFRNQGVALNARPPPPPTRFVDVAGASLHK